MRTIEQINADLIDLKIAIERAHDDDRPDMEDDYQSLMDELGEAEEAANIWRSIQAPTGGLDLVKVAKAFGGIPKDWDEGFLP
jgi:hypothetical protein